MNLTPWQKARLNARIRDRAIRRLIVMHPHEFGGLLRDEEAKTLDYENKHRSEDQPVLTKEDLED